MAEDETSKLTVAKLKALCILNDLATSGKKADLVERLLESGLSREEVGLTPIAEESDIDSQESEDAPEPEGEEEISLSLEDEDTIAIEVEDEAEEEPEEDAEEEEEEIFEAESADDGGEEEEEILEAEIMEAELVEEDVFVPAFSKTSDSPTTLLDMVKKPQVAVALVTIMILAAGGWWYLNSQLDPFTADQLRYGDDMRYSISEGEFIATEEFLSLVLDRVETEDDICKLRLEYSGMGDITITDGDGSELNTQSSMDRLGAVNMKGGQGMSWLTVESQNNFDFNEFTIQRHLRSVVPGSNACSTTFGSATGSADVTTTQWTELRARASIATRADWSLSLEGEYSGTAMSYGVGGLLGGLETLAPGFALIMQPVEIKELFGSDLITDGATGSNLGWNWRVMGAEEIGSTSMWKISATHADIEEYCLGIASMTLWVEESNPWASRQAVDVVIQGSQDSRTGCSTTSKLLGDYVLPEGQLEIHHMFEKSNLNRGVKQLEYGKDYDNRPQANELKPASGDLSNWGVNDVHYPDNSSKRTQNLEDAMACFEHLDEAIAAQNAVESDGYIWRAIDNRSGQSTIWNVSWVANDGTAGWVKFSLTGDASDENCEYITRGMYDDTVGHNRDSIPEALSLAKMETRLMDQSRYPELSGSTGIFTSSGDYHPETRVGHLVVTPGGGDLNSYLTQLIEDGNGATTVDMSRTWSSGGYKNSMSMAADATDGRLIGWNYVKTVE